MNVLFALKLSKLKDFLEFGPSKGKKEEKDKGFQISISFSG